ncbi:MAG: RNA polymerase sigma factor [Clostridia bacterium]|nr:RNA polymerase sigma factor [Clostridia bacterium]MBQ2518193.1 RNA polymerase sigma factor [Clostridia bacterium]MBQ4342239.1 RNA polymerase sigma factor [Clostridia bacterium]
MKNDALRLLYEKYSREILTYLLSLGLDAASAEDLMQETFVKALLSLDESHQNARAWLYAVARNLFLDRARRRIKELPESTGELAGVSPPPEEHLMKRLVSERLAAAILKLEPRKREVIVLRYYSELSFAEVSSIMGIGYDNVRVLAHRAKKDLKKFLEDEDDEIQ